VARGARHSPRDVVTVADMRLAELIDRLQFTCSKVCSIAVQLKG